MIQLNGHEASKMLSWIAQEHAYYVARIIEDSSLMHCYQAVSALEWMKAAMIVEFKHASDKEYEDYLENERDRVIEA